VGVYIHKFGKISVKISVLGSYTLIVAPMGVKFGVEEWTPISAMCHPCGAKNLKIGLSVTYILALCAAHNAASNNQKHWDSAYLRQGMSYQCHDPDQ